MDTTKNFGEYYMNQSMNSNQFFMNNYRGISNNQMLNQNFIQNPMINQMNNSSYNINPNMNQNNNNIILNNQMMNMMNIMNMNLIMMNMNMTLNNNQINQNFISNNNNDLNNDNIYNLDKDRLNLVNSLIEFYKENNMELMNFEYPNQIKGILNLLNENYSGFKYENDVKDPLFYIKGPKIIIKFINLNYQVKKVEIPKSITQYDLYTVANLYKLLNISKILLIHKNKILNKDESSIDCISNNDNIIIIEPLYFPDDSYYNSLKKKCSNNFCNIQLTLYNGQKLFRTFPSDITIGEICKAFYLMLGRSNFHLFYFINSIYGSEISINDQRKLKEFGSQLLIRETGHNIKGLLGTQIHVLGKQINFTIFSDGKKVLSYIIGILNNIKDIMKYIEPIKGRMAKKIKIGEIEIKKDENKILSSLLSLGITKDFDCQIEFEEKINWDKYEYNFRK